MKGLHAAAIKLLSNGTQHAAVEWPGKGPVIMTNPQGEFYRATVKEAAPYDRKFVGKQGSKRRSRKGRTTILPNGYARCEVNWGTPDNPCSQVVAYPARPPK